MDALASAVLLAVVVKAVLDYIAEPLRTKFPQLDLWWFNYVALVCGAVVAWFAELNLFASQVPNPILGRILTALVVGGGAKMLNDVFGSRELAAPVARDIYSAPTSPQPRKRGW